MIDWFKADFSKEGPGIRKDAPKKTGLALLMQVVLREWWELFKLNLMIVVFSLPIVTIPATLAAATHISLRMIEDESIYLRRDFLAAFRQHLLRATLWGAGFAIALGIGGYATFVYAQLMLHSVVYVLPLVLALACMTYAWIVSVCVFVLMVRRPDLSGRDLLRLAALAALTRPLPALAALGFVLLLGLLHVIFYPASAFMPAVFLFSLAVLTVSFSTYRATDAVLTFGREARKGTAIFADAPRRM